LIIVYIDHPLDDPSLDKAQKEAARRQLVNETCGLKGRNFAPAIGDISLSMHVLGAKGELAVAQYLNVEDEVFKDQIPTRGSVDLPPNIDVKTRSRHWMDLVVQLDDDPQKIFVHATSENDFVRLHGWTYGHRVMKPCFQQDPAGGRPAYFVRASVLHSMSLLKDFLVDLGYSK
jgi:hypothetical protein